MISRIKFCFEVRRVIATSIALALLLASVPVIPEFVAARTDSRVTISLDLCHPLQSLDRAPENVPLARPEVFLRVIAPTAGQPRRNAVVLFKSQCSRQPDAPPPRSAESILG